MKLKKKKMTEAQEFEILKLVLDKFLWLGFIIMGWGLYQSLSQANILAGLWYLVSGAVVLIIFMALIVKEYHIWK